MTEGTAVRLGILEILKVISKVDTSTNLWDVLHVKQDINSITVTNIFLCLGVRLQRGTFVAAKNAK